MADQTVHSSNMIPFATLNPNESNPDLMYEIRRQLEILFANQNNTADFKTMMAELESVADEARNVSGDKEWKVYRELKRCQYEYLDVLSEYVPKLLANEKFFASAFS